MFLRTYCKFLFALGLPLIFLQAFAAPGVQADPQLAQSNSERQRNAELTKGAKERAMTLNEEGVALILAGEKGAGVEKVEAALGLDPENTTILYNLAGLYLSDGKGEDAIRAMNRAVALDPKDLSFKSRLAEAHVASKNFEKAAELYEGIVQADRKCGEVMLKLGSVYGLMQNWEKATDALEQARAVLGRDARVLSNLGSILIVQGRHLDAVRVLREAQEVNKTPENAIALGVAYEAMGKFPEAATYFHEAKSLGARGEEITTHIRELEGYERESPDDLNEELRIVRTKEPIHRAPSDSTPASFTSSSAP